MNQSITLNIETFDISNYFNSLCKKMSEVFYDVINTGCARVANYNATNRKYLLANKNRMITRLKELAADIQATVSTTLNKIKKEHYNKKDFFIKAMDNVIAEHSRRFKKSKLENNNKSIESEITYVKEIVNNYCSYYDMKQDIIIASSASPSLLLTSSKSSNNNKINDDNNMSGKKRKNDELNLFIADEIKEKKTKDADGREERQKDAKKKEEEKQKKEIARKAAEDKEDEKKKKEKERKKAAEEKEKQKIEMTRKAAEDNEEKKKKEKERKKAAEEKEKQKIEMTRKAAEDNEEKKKKEKEKNDNKEIVEKAEEEHEEMDVEDEKMMNADNKEVEEEEMIENQLNEIENNLIDLLQKIKSTNGLEQLLIGVNQLFNLVKQAKFNLVNEKIGTSESIIKFSEASKY
jgi:hypothetical protein